MGRCICENIIMFDLTKGLRFYLFMYRPN